MTSADVARHDEFDALLEYLKQSRGFDFTAYKPSSLARRVQKRMRSAGIESYAAYGGYLEAHPQEFTQLFNTIQINVTSFFRDPPTWEFLAADVIPRALESQQDDASIRAWSAGCSSGEEAYTIAMLLADALGVEQFRERVKIYATDVDEDALNEGRVALYSEQSIAAVPEAMVPKYFERSNGRYVFNRELRRSIIFGRHDLIMDPPISRVTLITCRNTLMYLNAEVQQRILARFHFGLREGGFLVLGKAEVLLTRSTAFAPVDLKKRIFTKAVKPHSRNGAPMLGSRATDGNDDPATKLREAAGQVDPTAQIVIDHDRAIALINDRAKACFNLTAADVGRPLSALELSYRPAELRSLIEQAWLDRRIVNARDVEWTMPAGDTVSFEVQVIPLLDSALDMLGTKVVFRDVTRYRRLEDELKNSHQELETANEELQSTNEELETTNEELQSTVEELETTNEELQSTNEELETMNEELQSTNEELQTANEQLRQSGDELNRANAFFENILASFRDGVLVVDAELRVHAWNSKAEDLWGLRGAEVHGKHLMNLDIGLPVALLKQPLRRCLSGESTLEQLTVPATNRRGKTVDIEVSCAPFRLGDNPTWGAIVVMDDTTPRPSAN